MFHNIFMENQICRKNEIFPILKKLWICYDIILFVIWLVGVMDCYVTKRNYLERSALRDG